MAGDGRGGNAAGDAALLAAMEGGGVSRGDIMPLPKLVASMSSPNRDLNRVRLNNRNRT